MNTLAVRDQENFVHNQRTAAAAKPLNQGIKGLAPKTPGNNGFKSIVNAHKTIRNGKGGDENAAPAVKTAKAVKTSFVTPTAQRERAPLGAKTTNIKAKAFQTPAPLTIGNGFKTQARTTSGRKAKLKIHKPEIVQHEAPLQLEDEEEPEIEYCPPKITELPDYPDDPLDLAHLPADAMRIDPFRDWSSMYANRRSQFDEDAGSDMDSEKRFRLQDEEVEQSINEDANKLLALSHVAPHTEHTSSRKAPTATTAKHTKHTLNSVSAPGYRHATKPSSSLTAVSAAAALSNRPIPRFAQPTAATSARTTTVASPAAPSGASPRIPSAARNTLGYAAGRKASSLIKQRRQAQSAPQEASVSNTCGNVQNTGLDGRITPPWLAVYGPEDTEDETSDLFGTETGDLFAACDEYINGLAGPDFKLDIADVQ